MGSGQFSNKQLLLPGCVLKSGVAMRILYLSSSGKLGGAETCLLNLIGGLRERHPSWALHLITAEDGSLVTQAKKLGVTVHLLPFPASLASAGKRSIGNLFHVFISSVRYGNALKAAVEAIHPAIVHSNGFKMHLLTAWMLPNRTSLCHLHDYLSRQTLAGRALLASLGRFAAIVTNSRSVSADLNQIKRKAPLVLSIHNGIDIARFTPAGPSLNLEALSRLPVENAAIVRVGLIATFAKWKGHRTFLHAIALLPITLNFRAFVIGGPIYQTKASQHSMEELRAEAEQLGIAGRVGFTGFLEDSVAALRSLDIVVHASTDPEPFGMVLIEAMACGKALVASSGGGALEIFEEGVTALGHIPGNARSLASAMGTLIRDEQQRAELGRNARRAVEARFSSKTMSERFSEVYLYLAERGPSTELIVNRTAA